MPQYTDRFCFIHIYHTCILQYSTSLNWIFICVHNNWSHTTIGVIAQEKNCELWVQTLEEMLPYMEESDAIAPPQFSRHRGTIEGKKRLEDAKPLSDGYLKSPQMRPEPIRDDHFPIGRSGFSSLAMIKLRSCTASPSLVKISPLGYPTSSWLVVWNIWITLW